MPRTSKLSLHRDFIKFLRDIKNQSSRQKILAHCRKHELDCISEIFVNFLRKNLTTNKKIIKKLHPHKALIRQVALKRTPLKRKKQILSSSTGGSILSVLLPLAVSLIGKLFA